MSLLQKLRQPILTAKWLLLRWWMYRNGFRVPRDVWGIDGKPEGMRGLALHIEGAGGASPREWR
ncbi:MAG: hypothetical protein AABZ67_00420 [Pseudomonadota bacterium]